jgi:hypothetical protein
MGADVRTAEMGELYGKPPDGARAGRAGRQGSVAKACGSTSLMTLPSVRR